MAPPTFTIAVVMPTFNRAPLAFEAALAVLRDPGVHQLVVVDDGSSDDTVARLQSIYDPRLRIVPLVTNQGRSRARQQGIENATGDVVLILDDDVIAGPNLASKHLEHHRHDEHLVMLGYMPVAVTADSPVTSRIYAHEYEGSVAAYRADNNVVLAKLWGGNVSLRRHHALRVGLVSEGAENSYHEDQDFGLRCRAAGLHGAFDERLLAEHRHQRGFDAFLRDAYNRGVGLSLIRQRYGDIAMNPLPPVAALGSPAIGRLARILLLPAMYMGNRAETAATKILRRLAQYHGAIDYTQGVR